MFEVAEYGPYSLLRRLAVGGMAELFVALDNGEHGPRLVVIKRVLPDHVGNAEFVKMFIDEALIVSNLRHPGIVRMLKFGEQDSTYFIAMEYVEGFDLETVFYASRQAKKPMTVEESAYILENVCRALDYAHARVDSKGKLLEIVHRDISPDNLLVGLDGRVKILDFGIAKAAQRLSITRVGTLKGKLGYMAPELFTKQKIDGRYDVFSAGVVLWQMLAGRRLFAGLNELALVEKFKGEPLPAPSQHNTAVPARLDAIVAKAVAFNRDQRYPTAAAMADDLEAWLKEQQYAGGAAVLAARIESLFHSDIKRRRSKLRAVLVERGLGTRPAEATQRPEKPLDEPVAQAPAAPSKASPPPAAQPRKVRRTVLLGALGALAGTAALVVWWLVMGA